MTIIQQTRQLQSNAAAAYSELLTGLTALNQIITHKKVESEENVLK